MRSLKDIKNEFPIFSRSINGKSLVYLDNASTTQKPRVVIDAITHFYESYNANIHRGIHTLSEEATERYEESRARVAKFIHAKSAGEIVFTKSCTESINLVARSWGNANISSGDEILVSAYEHHANLVPWQELVKERRAVLKIIPLKEDLSLDMDAYERLLSNRTKLVCITAQSNVLGIKPPLENIIALAHEVGARVLVDGAQSVGHEKTHVQKLKCDFFVFSAHKMLGPTGVGVLYAPAEVLDSMPPYQFGGDMVTAVQEDFAHYREAPWKFEAGTPNIADVVAFPAAMDFLESIGFEAIEENDAFLVEEARKRFLSYPCVTLFPGRGVNTKSILSFAVAGVHPHDIATVFNVEGVAIRSGLHCAEPLVRRLGVPATARMSFYVTNDLSDVDRAEKALQKVFRVFDVS
ncbi:MAG: SufS family cysteine desulfurase [bacterium]|nr:SufS family cysteine desulfurase [bacterium]